MEEIRSLEDLLDLQAEDSAIDRLLDRRGGMPQLQAYRKAHDRVAAIDGEMAAASERLRDLDLELDKSDGELKLGEQKLEREERRLFAGGLTAKEAEHLRREVEMLRRQNSESEDRVLELMESREATQAEIEQLSAQRESAASEEKALESEIQAAWREIDAEIARHEAKKKEIVPLLPGELVELYEEMRPHKEGVAAARLAEGVCGGCHLALSAAEQAEILAADPPRCLHCRRILVPQ
jgi:predicted  nucleic acid-binding Zn-ribbon protein